MNTLFPLFLIISVFSFSQKQVNTINLSDSGNILNADYLKQLDSIFEKSKIIGLGESTHGTSEFTTIRAEIFKFLVANHNYTLFFLEADYNACSRINRYIHGAEDDAKEALLEVRLWPWLTQELLDFVEWMRVYNLEHDNVLEFVGCDMQLIVDDREELVRYLSMDTKFDSFQSTLSSLDFDISDSSLLHLKKKEWLEFSKAFLTTFPEEEPLIVTSINQWFENATSEKYKGNFRDSCMGNNIADYLELRPKTKGIYFAHNEHISKRSNRHKKNRPIFRRAGSFLDERLKDEYYTIGLEFNTGSFNSINYIDKEYAMEYFTFNTSNRKSLAFYILAGEDQIKFVTTPSIPDTKRLKTNDIGAIYGKSKSGYKIHRFSKLEKDYYDAFIVINKGTHTKLLTMESKKNSD